MISDDLKGTGVRPSFTFIFPEGGSLIQVYGTKAVVFIINNNIIFSIEPLPAEKFFEIISFSLSPHRQTFSSVLTSRAINFQYSPPDQGAFEKNTEEAVGLSCLNLAAMISDTN